MNPFSLLALRITYVLLFSWFGSQQLLFPSDWVGFLPEWLGYLPIPGEMLVQLNGLVEVLGALLLGIGVYVRWIAGFLALHLFGIAMSAGGAIGVRDAGLAMIGVALAMSSSDRWTMDSKNQA